jgi:hypothetical protein
MNRPDANQQSQTSNLIKQSLENLVIYYMSEIKIESLIKFIFFNQQ